MRALKVKSNDETRPRGQRTRPHSTSILKIPILIFLSVFISTLTWLVHGLLIDNPIGFSHHGAGFVDWSFRRERVKDAFTTSWDAYTKVAFGMRSSYLM